MATSTLTKGSYLHQTYSALVSRGDTQPAQLATTVDEMIASGIAELTEQAAAVSVKRMIAYNEMAPTPGRLSELATNHTVVHLGSGNYQVTTTITGRVD